MAERLLSSGLVKIVRIGHPARLLPSVLDHTIDNILQSSSEGKIIRDIRSDIAKMKKSIENERDRNERKNLWSLVNKDRKALKLRELSSIRDIIRSCDVVLATCSGSDSRYLRDFDEFDLVVIDEAAQGIEAECWIPILKGRKCILAGDHKQLPPTIHSKTAGKKGLEKTLFERLIDLYGEKISKMLVIQYRMNDRIMEWSSDLLYESKLVSDPNVSSHLLSHISGVQNNENTDIPLLFIDTFGCSMNECEDSRKSKYNEGEANIVEIYVKLLINSGVPESHIAIIAPYFSQVSLLRTKLKPIFKSIEINTVDGFQGREKEVIIISTVRSNDRGKLGFLKEKRRMNVAVTRAKRQCCIIGDSETLKKMMNS